MSAEASVLHRTWQVGSRTVTLTVQRPKPGQVMHATAEWLPDVPSKLEGNDWREYVAGRRAALADMAGELGLHVASIDA